MPQVFHYLAYLCMAAILLWQAPQAVGVLLAPRRTGARLAEAKLLPAAMVHAASLAACWGVLTLGGQVLLLLSPAPGGGDYLLRTVGQFLSSSVMATSARLHGVGPALALAVLVGLGEAYYWSLGIVVLGSWSGAALSQIRLAKRSAVIVGYASLWLIPAAAGWALAAVLYRLSQLSEFRPPVGSADLARTAMLLGACLCLTALPAALLGMALRLAAGMADALGPPSPADDKLCEFCGYNLHATGFAQRCPECGEPAAPSLGGVGRVLDYEVGRAGYFRTLAEVLLWPGEFFRRMPVRHGIDAARRFLAGSTVLSSILYMLVFATALMINSPMRGLSRLSWANFRVSVYLGLLTSGLWASGVMVLSMVSASVLAGGSRRRRDRLGNYGATKVACYLSALAVPWSLALGAMACVTAYLRTLNTFGRTPETTYILAWAVVAVLLLVWYWIAGARGYEAAQFANT